MSDDSNDDLNRLRMEMAYILNSVHICITFTIMIKAEVVSFRLLTEPALPEPHLCY